MPQVLRIIRQSVKRAGSQAELAKQLGVSAQYLSDVLAERRVPGPKILEGLGLTTEQRFARVKESAE